MTRPQILVVDDCRMSSLLLRYIFERRELACDTASSGLEGLAKFREGDHRIVFLDIMMPEIDGFEVARRIRALERDPQPEIVFMTSMGELFRPEIAEELHPIAVFFKPISPTAVIELVDSVLSEPAMVLQGEGVRRSEGD